MKTIEGAVPLPETVDEAMLFLYSRLPFLIQRASQVLTAMFTRAGDASAVTLPQYQLLRLFDRSGASSQVELARKAGVDAATVGLILRNLVEAGLVDRKTDTLDARCKIVSLTQSGSLALKDAAKRSRAVDKAVSAKLGGDALRLAAHCDRLGGGQVASAATEGDLQLALKLRRVLQVSERAMAEAVGPLGLTMRQFAVLYMLRYFPGITKAELVRHLGYELSNMTLVLRILIEKHLIAASNQKRLRQYSLTPAGLTILAAAAVSGGAAERMLIDLAGDQAADELQDMLGHVIRVFDKDMRQPIPMFTTIQSHPLWPIRGPGPFSSQTRTDRS